MLMNFIRKVRAHIFPKQQDSATKTGKIDPLMLEYNLKQYRIRGYKIGRGVRLIGHLDSINPHLITIGDFSVIGMHAAVLTHCPIKGAQPCRIGNYVYLAFGVLILPGVTIGDFCVIGAGSVVTKDIPSHSIAAGNPARVLRPMSEIEKAHLKETMESYGLFGWDPKRS